MIWKTAEQEVEIPENYVRPHHELLIRETSEWD